MELYFKSLWSYFPIFPTFISNTLCTPRKYQSRLIGVQCIRGMSGKYSYFGSNMEHSGTPCKSCTYSSNSDSVPILGTIFDIGHICTSEHTLLKRLSMANIFHNPNKFLARQWCCTCYPCSSPPHTSLLLSGGLSAHQRQHPPTTSSHTPSHAQGCISCGVLLSGTGAHGVSSEHMENMEMFSCSPT